MNTITVSNSLDPDLVQWLSGLIWAQTSTEEADRPPKISSDLMNRQTTKAAIGKNLSCD